MARKREIGSYAGDAVDFVMPVTGPEPPRPNKFRYRSHRSGEVDQDWLEWGVDSTSDVATYVVEWSDNWDMAGTWTELARVTNTGVANTYALASQVPNRWFRVYALNSYGNQSLYAGPEENRRPGRTVTVKGYFVDLNGDPVQDPQITVSLDVASTVTSVEISGYRRVEITPEIVTVEAETGFWEIKLLSSNEFTGAEGISGTPGYIFTFRGKGTFTTTTAKVAPDGSSEDIFFRDLAAA